MPPIILKVGGSLFNLPDLGARLSTLLQQHCGHRFLLFPGGGDAADLVRGWQPRFGWTDAVAHDVAIASLDFNAALLAKIVPSGCCVRTRADAEVAWSRGESPILAPSSFLGEEERLDPDTALPHTWDVTSDSLAAWTGLHWPAEEIWLCKSTPCPRGDALTAVRNGEIDPHLACIADQLPTIRWCNLRDAEPKTVQWLHS